MLVFKKWYVLLKWLFLKRGMYIYSLQGRCAYSNCVKNLRVCKIITFAITSQIAHSSFKTFTNCAIIFLHIVSTAISFVKIASCGVEEIMTVTITQPNFQTVTGGCSGLIYTKRKENVFLHFFVLILIFNIGKKACCLKSKILTK